jgi:heme/copper-type cytochrome/quinol oxidase subunit 2
MKRMTFGQKWLLRANQKGPLIEPTDRPEFESMIVRYTMNNRRIGLAAVVLAVIAVAAGRSQGEAARAGEIKMTAQKYEFKPSTITVKKGDHVKLVITAVDRDHGIKLEAFHIDQKLPKGKPVTVEFIADQVGTFPFQCSQFCGLGHAKMKGQFVVQ